MDFKGSFRFVLADPNPHIQARNLVLLGLLLRDDDQGWSVGAFIKSMYSLHLDQNTFHIIRDVLHSILDGTIFQGENLDT